MKLYRATDEIAVEHPTVVIVGDPGVGKSTLGYGGDDALLIDGDKGAHRAKNRRDTVAPDSWREIEELIANPNITKEAFGKSFKDYRTVVVDTAGAFLDLLTLDITDKNSKHGVGGQLFRDGWGQLKSRFVSFTSGLKASGKDLVLLCHGKEEKDGETKIVRPNIQGGSLGIILAAADAIGYYRMDGKRRVIEWNPSDRWIAKSPGWQTMEVPAFDKDPNFLATIQKKLRADLGKMSADSAQAANQVAELLTSIAATESLDELNTLLANKDQFPSYVRSQIRPALMERGKALGGVVNKGAFVPKAEAVA